MLTTKPMNHVDNQLKETTKSKVIQMQMPVTISAVYLMSQIMIRMIDKEEMFRKLTD